MTTTLTAPTNKPDAKPTYEWIVFSTAIVQCWLMLICTKTGKTGSVRDPTKEEWAEAFHAPAKPYRWHDDSRVVID